jgi:GNAT superfamily N-acetyltransferase
MNEIIVRSAVDNDLETLYRFEQGIITTERPFDPTLKEGHINYYDLAAMIPAPHIELVVAEAGGRVVGSGYARIEDSKVYLKHARHAYLGFMFVEPDYLKQWAVLQNITEMRLEVYDDNLPAVKAYEKFGFTKLLMQMRIGIDCDL